MVEEVSKEQFNNMLKDDCGHDCMLHRDYDYFKEHYRSSFENSREALQELIRLHRKYGFDWTLESLEELI